MTILSRAACAGKGTEAEAAAAKTAADSEATGAAKAKGIINVAVKVLQTQNVVIDRDAWLKVCFRPRLPACCCSGCSATVRPVVSSIGICNTRGNLEQVFRHRPSPDAAKQGEGWYPEKGTTSVSGGQRTRLVFQSHVQSRAHVVKAAGHQGTRCPQSLTSDQITSSTAQHSTAHHVTAPCRPSAQCILALGTASVCCQPGVQELHLSGPQPSSPKRAGMRSRPHHQGLLPSAPQGAWEEFVGFMPGVGGTASP